MFVVYTEADVRGDDVVHVRWWDDRIVSCLRQRAPMSERVRNSVINFGDLTSRTENKHYVPSSRIGNQLVKILTTMGTEDGRGMTRQQSVEYLKWVLAELEMARICPDYLSTDFDLVEAVGVVAPSTEPRTNRLSYDKWMSWAIEAICDWPSNLFQGRSEGDGGGYLLDKPLRTEGFNLRQRIAEAALWLKLTIPGLKISPRVTTTAADAEHGWALHIDKLWESGPPTQSRFHNLHDPWFLPIYHRTPHHNESTSLPAAPDELFSKSELRVISEDLRGKLHYYSNSWGFR